MRPNRILAKVRTTTSDRGAEDAPGQECRQSGGNPPLHIATRRDSGKDYSPPSPPSWPASAAPDCPSVSTQSGADRRHGGARPCPAASAPPAASPSAPDCHEIRGQSWGIAPPNSRAHQAEFQLGFRLRTNQKLAAPGNVDRPLSLTTLNERECVRGPACVLERLSQALAGLLPHRPLPGDLGPREDQLPPNQQTVSPLPI